MNRKSAEQLAQVMRGFALPKPPTPRYHISDLPRREVLLWWQKRGLQFTSTGYGSRIPTAHMVQLPGSSRWRRVYVCIYSNSGTAYVGKPGHWEAIIWGAP